MIRSEPAGGKREGRLALRRNCGVHALPCLSTWDDSAEMVPYLALIFRNNGNAALCRGTNWNLFPNVIQRRFAKASVIYSQMLLNDNSHQLV